MKTAKPPPVPDGAGSSSRRQPVRQTRANPPRTSSLIRANPLASAPAPEQPINILPGVTHFADAITALPKELVRHFTLLKEVDAKIFAPEAALFQLLHSALDIPVPDVARPPNDGSSYAASVSAPMSITGSANPAAPASDGTATSVFDPANIPRRTIFRDTALKIQEMLVSLEEKNHVIATANDALQKQLSRIDEIWPHLEAEFSDEAKWGSTTHWAYVENRQAKSNDKQAERSRREGAATLSAAAQALAEEAAARSSDRKQALAAKKNSKNQVADADGDKNQETGKRTQAGKSRKPLPDSGPVGLGITSAPAASASANKRRKVEAKPNGSTPTERAMGSVFGSNASKQRTTSPRETPAPESGTKKRKALPTSSNQAKKSRTNAAMSPSVTSSPVIGTLPDPAKGGRGSPAPSAAAPRSASSRARQNSTQSNAENARQRPASAVANKPNGHPQGTPDPGQPSNGQKANPDVKAQKETTVPIVNKPSPLKPETDEHPPAAEPAQNGSKKENPTIAYEDLVPLKKESSSLAIQPTPASSVRTKSGRASKPSTPAIATFAEAASTTASTVPSRSRSSRNNTDSAAGASSTTTTTSISTTSSTTATAKRSHKRGASVSATATQAAQQAAAAAAAAAAAEKDKEKDKEKEKDPVASGDISIRGNASGAGGGSRKDKDRTAAVDSHSQSQSNTQGHGHSHGHAVAKASGAGAAAAKEEEVDDDEEDDEDQDVGDELYCYCNQVSYGEMVACDGEGCPREWFHLECVGLKVAPKGNAKWYCEDCKKRLKIGERR
ncbi:hypothetical protein N657DRAFT_656905 [Parathielavia appendiculata]|uniref:Chromatin modification-related protein n=1 Tax=Parathielavia appendiculata TaxID=2587402 RepID=A0AAN6TY43_9PEZI|nr:hypothetical protein N657DRAFT_656905 [Parathielavia appendiculata]